MNTRIINITNNRVGSTSQAYVDLRSVPSYLMPSQKVVFQDGLLSRDNHMGEKEVRVIGDLK